MSVVWITESEDLYLTDFSLNAFNRISLILAALSFFRVKISRSYDYSVGFSLILIITGYILGVSSNNELTTKK